MPTLGCHVPDDSPLYAKAQERAKERHDGKVSAYVRSTLEKDLNGEGEIPEASDERFLERVLESVLPAKADRFGAQWRARQAALPIEEQGDAITQGEVATALLTAFLDTFTAGHIPAAQTPSFVVLSATTWNTLLAEAIAGDIHGLRTTLRANDTSGATVTYDFPSEEPRIAADPETTRGLKPIYVSKAEATKALQLAAEHRKSSAKHGSGKA